MTTPLTTSVTTSAAPDLPDVQRPAPDRLTIDASVLPVAVFGRRGLLWWGTLSFMVIEGTSLALAIITYYYLRLNAAEWPPRPASQPALLWAPTLNLIVILLAIVPAEIAKRAALRFDRDRTRSWLLVNVALTGVAVVLRAREFSALNVHWTTNAYGSSVWAILFLHGTLLLGDFVEAGVIALIFFTRNLQPKHFPDVEDVAFYQWFLSLAWLLLYVVVYLSPRVL